MTSNLISRQKAYTEITARGDALRNKTAWARFCKLYGSWEQYPREQVNTFLASMR